MRSTLLWAILTFASTQLALAAPAPQTVSDSSRCGASFGLTCTDSTYGNCCSQHNYCGSTNDYCNTANGCQSGWGVCNAASTPSIAPKVSLDGKCGSASGTCKGSEYGDCCSQHGWCGSTSEHCATDCNPLFGTCSGSSPLGSSSATPILLPSSSIPAFGVVITTNARCGNEEGASPQGMTCRGSQYGDCCSKWGYCGSSSDYCDSGCQPGFGECQPLSSSSPSTPSPSSSAGVSLSTTSTTDLDSAAPHATSSTQSISCPLKGSPKSNGDTYYSYQWSTTLSVCMELCRTNTVCQYFVSQTASSGALDCYFYNGQLSNRLPTEPSTMFEIYDKSCALPSSSISSSASSTSIPSPTIISSSVVTISAAIPSATCALSGRPTGAIGNAHYSELSLTWISMCYEQCLNDSLCQYFVTKSARREINCYFYGRSLSEDLPIVPLELGETYKTYDKSCAPLSPSISSSVEPSSSVASSTPVSPLSICNVLGLPTSPFPDPVLEARENTLVGCAARCIRSSECVTYLFSREQLICSLFDKVPAASAITLAEGFIFSERDCSTSPLPQSSTTSSTSTAVSSSASATTLASSSLVTPPITCDVRGHPYPIPFEGTTMERITKAACNAKCVDNSKCVFILYLPMDALCVLYEAPLPEGTPIINQNGYYITSERSCLANLPLLGSASSPTSTAASSTPVKSLVCNAAGVPFQQPRVSTPIKVDKG